MINFMVFRLVVSFFSCLIETVYNIFNVKNYQIRIVLKKCVFFHIIFFLSINFVEKNHVLFYIVFWKTNIPLCWFIIRRSSVLLRGGRRGNILWSHMVWICIFLNLIWSYVKTTYNTCTVHNSVPQVIVYILS